MLKNNINLRGESHCWTWMCHSPPGLWDSLGLQTRLVVDQQTPLSYRLCPIVIFLMGSLSHPHKPSGISVPLWVWMQVIVSTASQCAASLVMVEPRSGRISRSLSLSLSLWSFFLCLFLCSFLSISLFLSVCVMICLSVWLSVCLCDYKSFSPAGILMETAPVVQWSWEHKPSRRCVRMRKTCVCVCVVVVCMCGWGRPVCVCVCVVVCV